MITRFSVTNWCGWMPSERYDPNPAYIHINQTPSPETSAIPPMLRRRLNPLGRAAASQILTLLQDPHSTALVYGSRHGDIERTLSVLQDLAAGVPISPMNFSLTVHNAITGIVSIHSKITGAISSIAAGDSSLVPVLLEAAGLLTDTCQRVVCIFADSKLPDFYGHKSPGREHAFALILSKDGGIPLELEYKAKADSTDKRTNTDPEILSFFAFLESTNNYMSTLHSGSMWQISKSG